MFVTDCICMFVPPLVIPGIFIAGIEDISGVGVGAAFGLMSMPGIEDMSGVGVRVECWPTAAPTSRIRHESNRHILL